MSAPVLEDDPLPQHLFHYTSAAGLHGILEGSALWATHAAYLNDSQELIFGVQKIQKELTNLALHQPDEAKSGWDPNLPYAKIAIPVAIFVTAAALSARLKQATDFLRRNLGPFVTCLSESPDQLSQWRGYGQGGGYAIRFDAQQLRESVQTHNATRRFVQMRYETTEQDASLRKQLVQFINTVASMVPLQPRLPKDQLAQRGNEIVAPMLDSLLGMAARQKHHGFEEEREYRIVTFANADFYTPQDNGLIPRMIVKFDPSCIDEIMIGPGQHMETRESSVRSYVQVHSDRYSHVEVTRSETPFTGV